MTHEFDLPFADVPIHLGDETIEVYANGIAHCLGENDGASVIDIWMICERDGLIRERMLDRSNEIERDLFRLLAFSVERHCKSQMMAKVRDLASAETRRAAAHDRRRAL